jgi:lambda family phage portal protein
MRVSLLDRLVQRVAPVYALKRIKSRMQFDVLASLGGDEALHGSGAFDAGGRDNGGSRRWRPAPRDAKADSLRDLPLQRGQSRELVRTSPIALGAINTNVDRVVGTGLALSVQPHRGILGWSVEQTVAWKMHVQAEFSLWADSPECDIAGTLNFFDQQGLLLRSTLESGDTFTILPDGEPTDTQPYRLRIQLLEGDRCGNPQGARDSDAMAGGVTLGPGGVPLSYFIYDRHPGGACIAGNRWAGRWYERLGRSGRRRILHHYRKLRPELPRGVPYLAPIVGCIKQLTRYTEAEIAAAVISSYFTVFIKSDSGSAVPPVFQGEGAPGEGGAGGNVFELGPAAIVDLAKGEEAQFANPLRPNPNFDPFVLAVLRQIGMALGIPYELLIKKFDASYSASRAALLDAAIYFRSVRTWLARTFCQPVYETWMAEAVARGRVTAPGFFTDPLLRWAYTRALWHGDSMGSINPKDEVAAYRDAVDARFMSRERAEWELFGTDWNDTFDQKVAEEERLRKANILPTPKAGAAAPPKAGGEANPPEGEST